MKITIFLCILHIGNFCHSLMTINRPTSETGVKELEEKFQQFLEAKRTKPKRGTVDKLNPQKKKPKPFLCDLKCNVRKYACSLILESEEMESLENDLEHLKSRTCQKFEIRYVEIANPEDPKKIDKVNAFQCPPTRMVNEPYFLTDGEDNDSERSLFVLHREKGDPKLLVVAHVTDVRKTLTEFNDNPVGALKSN